MFSDKIQLESDETILLLVRKHWFILTVQILSIVIGALFPLLVMLVYTLTPLNKLITLPLESTPIITSLYAAWLILMWMALFNLWTNYYLDVWTVTNKRLILVDQHGLFHRSIASFRLERLQDISVTIQGIIGTLLKFGAIHIHTASEEHFVAHGMPDPQELKSLILQSTDKITYARPTEQNTRGATPLGRVDTGEV